MGKKFLIMFLFGLLCQNSYANGNEIHFSVSIIDHSSSTQSEPKSPIRPITATFSNLTLCFQYAFSETVPVELLDEDGNVVYTDYLYAGQTSLTFPSMLSGEYTLRLTVGNYYYIGVIEL